MADVTIAGLSAITSPSSAAMLWVEDPNASPQDRSITLPHLASALAGSIPNVPQAFSYATSQAPAALIGNQFWAHTGGGTDTFDFSAGAATSGIKLSVVNLGSVALTVVLNTGASFSLATNESLEAEWNGTAWTRIGGSSPSESESWNVGGGSQASPSVTTWYNIGGSLALAVGVYDIGWEGTLVVNAGSSTSVVVIGTLSTANNSESESRFTTDGGAANVSSFHYSASREKRNVIVASATTYYLNVMTTVASMTSISIIRARIWARRVG